MDSSWGPWLFLLFVAGIPARFQGAGLPLKLTRVGGAGDDLSWNRFSLPSGGVFVRLRIALLPPRAIEIPYDQHEAIVLGEHAIIETGKLQKNDGEVSVLKVAIGWIVAIPGILPHPHASELA
jgi:hypothetical protein